MPTTGFSDNLKPDDWMVDLAWRVQELASEPERLRHFRDRLGEYWAREFSRVAGLGLWQREREQHLENAKSDERLQDLSAGPPPNHPSWAWECLPGASRGHWMPHKYILDNEPDISPALPFKDCAPTLWEAYAILAAVHDRVLSGLDRIVPRHNPQSDMSGEMLSQQKVATISHLQLLKQIPKLTQKDRPALEKCLVNVCTDLGVPVPATGRIEPPAVQVLNLKIDSLPSVTGTTGTGAAGVADCKGFVPADTLWIDHGIRQTRLCEAVAKGKVEKQPAPQGYKDSDGRMVKMLYHREQAVKHCAVERKARK